MELVSREMPADYEIIDTGDWHLGVANTNEDGILEMLNYVAAEPHRYLIIKGDQIDAIAIGDKRFSLSAFAGNIVTTPQEQADKIIEILRPIKDRILFMMLGNHELKLYNVFDFLKYWCRELDIPWGGYTCKFIHLKGDVPQWKGLFHHGSGSFRSQAKDPIQALANKQALLKKKLQRLSSDCIYMSMGHAHTMLLIEPTIENTLHLIDDGSRIRQTYRVDADQGRQYIDVEARWYACSGSFLGTMSQPGEGVIPYSEVAMYEPVEQGYLKLTITGHELNKVEKVVV